MLDDVRPAHMHMHRQHHRIARLLLLLVAMASCGRDEPQGAAATPVARPRGGPPSHAPPMQSGPHRGKRLSIACTHLERGIVLEVGGTTTCRPVAWELVHPKSTGTTNFEPYWRQRDLGPLPPDALQLDDQSVGALAHVGGSRFTLVADAPGRTTLRVTLHGASFAQPIVVGAAPTRRAYDWPMRDTTSPRRLRVRPVSHHLPCRRTPPATPLPGPVAVRWCAASLVPAVRPA